MKIIFKRDNYSEKSEQSCTVDTLFHFFHLILHCKNEYDQSVVDYVGRFYFDTIIDPSPKSNFLRVFL